MKALLVLVPLAPIAAALAAPLLGRRSGFAVVAGTALSTLFALLLLGTGTAVHTEWMQVGDLRLTVGLAVDALSGPTALLVAGVSLLVNVYSVGYMRGEEGEGRFFAWMGLFAGAMLALVLARSFLLLFAAWELVGLCSFALIGHHHREAEARRAAAKAFLMTRLGDGGLFLGWLLALTLTGTTELPAFLDAAPTLGPPLVILLSFLFLAAAIGKSAQLPLTAWLPDAMAGPSPVSALIHSATMVAAGVFLILRLWPLFELSAPALTTLRWVGAGTAVVAALVATAHADLKRILAWSTVSQLGEMMLALGLAGPFGAVFHLFAHAGFKSTLFLSAGAVQQATGTRQLPELGGLWRRLPVAAGAFAVAGLALAGVPPLAGFWSEEAILADATRAGPGWAAVLVLLVGLAGVYIGRAGLATFATRRGSAPRREDPAERAGAGSAAPSARGGPESAPLPVRETPAPTVRMGMAALAVVAAVGGLFGPALKHALPFEAPHPGWGWRLAAIAAGLAGLTWAWLRHRRAGPAPAFSGALLALARAVHGLAHLGARAALAGHAVAAGLERLLDALARGTGRLGMGAGRLTDAFEHRGLDRWGRGAAEGVDGLARLTDAAELQGFSRGGDELAAGIDGGGGLLARLQSGRLYLYTLGLFAVVLVAGTAAAVVFYATG